MELQSKLTFKGLLEFYDKYETYTFKHFEILMDEPIYLGFVVLELLKLLLYETFCDKAQPNFGKKTYTLSLRW